MTGSVNGLDMGVEEREDSTVMPSFSAGATGWLVMPCTEVEGGVGGGMGLRRSFRNSRSFR